MERFVVGTGRCGSTLLARMLAEHRDVVAIHELLNLLDHGRRFRLGLVAGAELADLLAQPQETVNAVLARGYTAPEVVYPFGTAGMRYDIGDATPAAVLSTLPPLTADPDRLFDDLIAFARSQPDQTMAAHYQDVFSWLAVSAGGSIWVERSGASIDYLVELVERFPDARFVHLHRDGHEAALSMRDYPFMRLAMAVLYGLFPDLDEDAAIRHVLETPPPLRAAGRFWCDSLLRGYRALGRIRPEQYLAVRFEDLVTDPHPQLDRIAGFFELPTDPAFVDRAAAIAHGLPPLRMPTLSADEQEELRRACRPGQILLGRGDGAAE